MPKAPRKRSPTNDSVGTESLSYLRHSLAHLLAAAVMELYPDAKRAIGPAIANGFYYDFEFVRPISDADLPKIENKMRSLLPIWSEFKKLDVDQDQAKRKFSDNPYKLELIEEFTGRGEPLTLYRSGDFVDLCRGGHVADIRKIDPHGFRLSKTAGAYWRGDEKKAMLTRIYGLAFTTKAELEDYLEKQKQALSRDHRKLGPQLDLFHFSDLVGSGLPLWTPSGTLVRNQLNDFVWELRQARGYEKVEIPHICKKELYETSGHWDKFKDELFKITSREGHFFAMKPMNCPHHIEIFARRPWSYRELPQRYESTTMCYRDEQTGELSGLSRARSFTQDDAHVFCGFGQIKEEFLKIWDIVHAFYGAFGFTLKTRLSLSDPDKPEAFLGSRAVWERTEGILREIVKEKKAEALEAVGEAAFYGPKLDFMAEDSLGREWQVATIQIDPNMPARFKLTFTDEQGEDQPVVMIHAAIMGSIERFLSILLEHLGGALPLWLSPVQIQLIPVSGDFRNLAQVLSEKMSTAGLRTAISEHKMTVGNAIRKASLMKIPYLIVLGEKEKKSNKLAVRVRGESTIQMVGTTSFIKHVQSLVLRRSLETTAQTHQR